jgi:hypothetical protein
MGPNQVRDVLGIELSEYDAMVKEVVGEYLELVKRESE